MDNRIFDVNGCGSGMLKDTLFLAMSQSGYSAVVGMRLSKTHGLMLYHTSPIIVREDYCKTPFPLTRHQVYPLVERYLEMEETWEKIELVDGEEDIDNDGDNSRGWRVYCGAWGQVGEDEYTFLAIKPCWLWHGK